MSWKFDSLTPLFLQVARAIEDDIISGVYAEESQIPSTTQVSAAYHLNPATVLKGYNLLADEDLIEKRRGMGLFVKTGAVERIKAKRNSEFRKAYVKPLVKESRRLSVGLKELLEAVRTEYEAES
jgi:Predicted transcriptional regulators